MCEQFYVKELPNGMCLLGQRMEHVSSAAMTIVAPAGSAYDPEGSAGAAAVAAEWVLRGAGDRDTRQLNDALDSLGCEHSETATSEHIHFSTAQLNQNLNEVLGIYADVLRRARLEEETFHPCRALILQDLMSLEDEPARKCMLMTREKFYPDPLGRCVYGQAESLEAMTAAAIRKHLRRSLSPADTIIAVAGDIEWESFCDLAERHFADWSADAREPVKTTSPAGGFSHVAKDSAQVHIAFAHRTATIGNEQYYAARMAETVLSGGMSSRLFTEVREKRGLVYHVSSSYHSLKDYAGMFTYAGTTPENAQETFEVTVGEIRRLADGITEEELSRARRQLKSSLVMQGESTSARANALAGDWYHLRRLRSLSEISEAIEKVSVEDVLTYLNEFPGRDFTVLVIGPEPLKTDIIEE